MSTNIVYLACPYSHPDRGVRLARYHASMRATGHLMARGVCVLAPILMTHPVAEEFDLPLGWDYWEAVDRAYIGACCKVYVLMLDGWRESIGVQAEIEMAHKLGLVVEYIGKEWGE